MMLTINDLKNGLIILIDEIPYQVLEVKHLHMGRGGSSVQTKIKNLKTGQVFSRNFKPADTFEEAGVQKKKMRFLYAHRENYVFADPEKPDNRFTLKPEQIGETKKWLKPNTDCETIFLHDAVLTIRLPIKIDTRVIEAPPGLRGDTASAGTKVVAIETGAKVSVPLFINQGDIIRVNTETGEYVERVEKAA